MIEFVIHHSIKLSTATTKEIAVLPHVHIQTVGLKVSLVYLAIQVFTGIIFQIVNIHQWYQLPFDLTIFMGIIMMYFQ